MVYTSGDTVSGGTTPDPVDPQPTDTTSTPDPQPVVTGDTITVAEALTIGTALADNATSTETYVVEGYVAKLVGTYNTTYGSQSFYMTDTVADGTGYYDFEAYQCTIASPGVSLGDRVRVTGNILKYVGTKGTTIEIKQGTIEIISGGTTPDPVDPDPVDPTPAGDTITVAQALAIGNALANSGDLTPATYTVAGYVAKVAYAYSSTSGTESFYMTDTVSDGTGFYNFEAYKCNVASPGAVLGDFVYVTGQIKKYVGSKSTTIEIEGGTVEIVSEPHEPVVPTGDTIQVSNLNNADAYLYEEDGYKILELDLYNDYTTALVYPEVYVVAYANSLTKLAGTYDLLYGGVWTSANDSVETDIEEEKVGELTITYANDVYTMVGNFLGLDGNVYAFNCTPDVAAYDGEGDEKKLDENGTEPEPVDPTEAITVEEAMAIGNELADNGVTTETYIVEGYVAKLYGTYNSTYGSQSFYMTDTGSDGTGYYSFEAFQCYVDAPGVEIGYKVRVTGQITKYVSSKGTTTIEIKNGNVEILTTTQVNAIDADQKAVKTLENGQLIILRNNRRYTVTGLEF